MHGLSGPGCTGRRDAELRACRPDQYRLVVSIRSPFAAQEGVIGKCMTAAQMM